jgi:hypothetical protein
MFSKQFAFMSVCLSGILIESRSLCSMRIRSVLLPTDTLDPLAIKNGLMLLATINFPTLIQSASFFSENCMIQIAKVAPTETLISYVGV